MSLPPDLLDELEAINAIYGPSTLAKHPCAQEAQCLLRPPPPHPLHPVTLLLSFPPSYPAAPPTVLGPHAVGPGAPRGAGAAAARAFAAALQDAAAEMPGTACIYAALEGCAEAEAQVETEAEAESDPEAEAQAQAGPPAAPAPAFVPAWAVTPPTEVHRSVFVGRACAVRSAADVAAATADLLLDKRAARATHNVRAWRLAAAATHQESDDDGEAAAGARVLAVAAGLGAWDVLVVVSRWYGGVKLGPERFRVMGRVAREALVLGGWGGEAADKEKEKGRKR